MHFGIDFGSKLAGTTVITFDQDGCLHQISSSKKEDADDMILNAVKELAPASIYLDAPLSLPSAYYGKGEDYFYRKVDKELKAMSPMFLGGLTARAMKLKHSLERQNIEVIETYPGALVRSIPELKDQYSKKDISTITGVMQEIVKLLGNIVLREQPQNIHQVDSILAWYSGFRHQKEMAQFAGDKEEGLIVY